MFNSLISRLTPAGIYVKIAILAVAMVAAGWMGHKLTQAHYLKREVKAQQAADAEYRKSLDEFKSSIEAKDKILRSIRKDNVALAKKLKRNETVFEEALKDAVQTSVKSGYSVGFGRVWNDSICRANGMPGCAGDPGGLASDRRASTITSEALLRNHNQLMKKLATCYRNIESIRELQELYREEIRRDR